MVESFSSLYLHESEISVQKPEQADDRNIWRFLLKIAKHNKAGIYSRYIIDA